jgi:predicted Rossmann fold nucleotide-binding protein DprA/Smf involved in DNA uptake
MKVAIIGSRSFKDYDLLKKTLNKIEGISLIVSGCAVGADTLGELYAKEKGIPTLLFRPDWKKYGKAAGFIRNREIIDNSDAIVAFWDGISNGTKHSISLAEKQDKKLIVIKYE